MIIDRRYASRADAVEVSKTVCRGVGNLALRSQGKTLLMVKESITVLIVDGSRWRR